MMADYGIQLGKLFFVGLLSVILTIDAVMGLQALYYWQLNRAETSEELYQPPAKLKALLNAQQSRLTDYRIVDADKGVIAIPVGRAMELVLAELSRKSGANTTAQGESR
jgi:hypothetical protein